MVEEVKLSWLFISYSGTIQFPSGVIVPNRLGVSLLSTTTQSIIVTEEYCELCLYVLEGAVLIICKSNNVCLLRN
jgi:hypothetical protein